MGAGGALYGHHSDMFWLPEQGVGAVLLTNGEPGWLVLVAFRRKLLEVLFDGRPEAASQLAADVQQFTDDRASDRALLTVPADPAKAAALAPRYRSRALGELVVERSSGRTVFDFGEFATEVGSRENPDGTTSYLVTDAGLAGFELVEGLGRTLVIRDAQHEYVFEPVTGAVTGDGPPG